MTKKNKILALVLVAAMALMLAACSVSSSSTSTTTVSTSVTDENGNTTTSTTTTEVGGSAGTDGVNTTSQTTTETTTTGPDGQPVQEEAPAIDPERLAARLHDEYSMATKGTNAAGDVFYYAYNDDVTEAVLVIVSADGTQYNGWEGYLRDVDDHAVIESFDGESEVPFKIEQTEDNVFTMTFLNDGDVANMEVVDLDSFVKDLVEARMSFE